MTPLLALALAAAAQPQCSVQTPAGCAGMYELVAAPGFQDALRRFVGGGRATWYEANADRTQQVFNMLSGPSADPVAVGPDLLRFDACHPYACNVRATLFISRAGEIEGAAMLFPECGGKHCNGNEELRLTIFRDRRHPDVAELARQWADANVASNNARFANGGERIARVAVEEAPPIAAVPTRRTGRPRR